MQSRCPNCAATITGGNRYCTACGTALLGGNDAEVKPDSSSDENVSHPGPVDQTTSADSARHERDWYALQSVAQLYVALLGVSVLVNWLSAHDDPAKIEIAGGFITAIVVLGLTQPRWRAILPMLSPSRLTARVWLDTAVVGCAAFAFVSAYFAVAKSLGAPMIDRYDDLVNAGWPLWVTYASASLNPAVFEEIAFRGYVQGILEEVMGSRQALVTQALLFSILHLLPMIFISHFVLGLAFGVARNRSKSLLPPMILHAAWNAFVVFTNLP